MNWYKTSQTQPAIQKPEKPNLVTTPSEIEAVKDFTERQVLFRFKNGWTVQKVKIDSEVEEDFIKVNSFLDKQDLYSLRNEHNVPRANFVAALSSKDPAYFGIYEVNYKYISEQKFDNETNCHQYLKQFFDFLKSLGMKPKWLEEPEYLQQEKVTISDLKEHIVDEMGIAPVVRNYGGDSDSYFEALKKAFEEAWGNSSYYYSNTANGLIDDIFAFAEAREEIGFLDDAVQKIEDWACQSFSEVDWGEQLPERPDEPTKDEFTREYKETPGQKEFKNKQFEKTKNVFFDEKAYNEAVKEYNRLEKECEEKENELKEYFEPMQFGNTAYKKLQALKARSVPVKSTKNKTKKSKKQ